MKSIDLAEWLNEESNDDAFCLIRVRYRNVDGLVITRYVAALPQPVGDRVVILSDIDLAGEASLLEEIKDRIQNDDIVD